tara:strand:- start:1453 stop:1647 length:195 start_codon:yes stop_codon:yes gene_type:complete
MKEPNPFYDKERIKEEMYFMRHFETFEEIVKEQYKEDMSEGLHNLDFYSWLILFVHAHFYQEEE